MTDHQTRACGKQNVHHLEREDLAALAVEAAAMAGPPLIKRLLPSAVRIQVSTGLSPGLGAALLERRIDMIVTTDPPAGAVAPERYPILAERFVLLLSKAMLKGSARTARVPTLAAPARALPLVRCNSDSHLGAQIEK